MKKLIEKQQQWSIVCDNPSCEYKLTFSDLIEKHLHLYIGKPCPLCGQNLLTIDDYVLHKRMMANIDFINRWFSWLTLFIPKKKLDRRSSVCVHVHDGIHVKKVDDKS